MKRYIDKTVLITGSSRGLGAATAKRFAKEGANIVLNYSVDEKAAAKLKEELESRDTHVLVVQADVSDEKQVQVMITKVVAVFGSLDVLVNNAGVALDIPFVDKSTEQWKRTLDVNLNGVYLCTKYALPYINQGGSIINIASTNGIDTYHPDSIDYDVSKAGVIMFTKAMARDLAPNIRINCIAPGWFNTDINSKLASEYVQSETDKIALGRFGKPEEIASVAAFLASDDASFMTGSVTIVDGGYGGAV